MPPNYARQQNGCSLTANVAIDTIVTVTSVAKRRSLGFDPELVDYRESTRANYFVAMLGYPGLSKDSLRSWILTLNKYYVTL